MMKSVERYACLTFHTERLHDDRVWQLVEDTVRFLNSKSPPLKFIHNNIVSEENKNRVLRKWVELEEELIRDANFMAKGKVYCRNLFMDAVKREYK